jgi:hypothetical protein
LHHDHILTNFKGHVNDLQLFLRSFLRMMGSLKIRESTKITVSTLCNLIINLSG